MPDVDDPFVAGVGALKAGVMRLYGVVVFLGRWVRVGCARLLCGHWVHSLWSGAREAATSLGPLLYVTYLVSHRCVEKSIHLR
jgi:hypothetical protein